MRDRLYTFKIAFGLLIQLAALLLATTCFAAATVKGGESTFWVVWNNGWRLINFGILIYFLVKWLKEPLMSYLQSRRKMIASEISEAERAKQKAEEEYQEAKLRLERLADEIQKILDVAVYQGEAQRDQILAEAKLRAETIVEQAKSAALMMMQEAKRKLREDMVETVVRVAEDKVIKSIEEGDQERLIVSYIKRLEQVPGDLRL